MLFRSVIGQEKDTGGIAVKTTNGIDALFACALDEIHHRCASVGVLRGGHAIFRLVEQDIAFAFESDCLSVVFDCVGMSDFCAEFGDDFSVDLDKPLLDIFVGLAAGADACVGEELVEADLFVG